ncbi:MAG: arylsulfatase [Parabacteroides sp.]|nr:arylsulfatase [Parabacteroides sp.]
MMDIKCNKSRALLLSIGGAACLTSCGSQPKMEEKAPNIVFILADDMGYGDVSFLNDSSKIQTTNIDRLAREGAYCTDAHSSSAVSTPTRYGILTGRYNWRSELKSGVLWGYSPALIPESRSTMASVLRKAGYETGCIGKWHLGWSWNNVEAGKDSVDFSKPITHGPTSVGFDYFYGIAGSLDMTPYVYVENEMPTSLPDRVTSDTGMRFWREGPTGADFDHEQTLPNFIKRAEDFIAQKAQGDKPFFLYLPLPAPHTPILPIKEFQGKSGLNPYGDFVLMVDAMVGRVAEALDKAGISENTILVFTTDNGCSPQARYEELLPKGHNPSYIYRGHKADLYEGGHRVPCVVRWPAKIKHHAIDQTICLTDFMRTFSALAGVRLTDKEGEDSYDLSPALLNEKPQPVIREATVHHSIDGDFTIRKGDWKLLLAAGSGGWSYPTQDDLAKMSDYPKFQLYNLADDPGETTNVCAQHPEVVKELKDLMSKYIKDGRSTPGAPVANDGDGAWSQLAYWMDNVF